MKADFLKFLFVDSQIQEEADEIIELLEKSDELTVNKEPLVNALKKIGVGTEGMEVDVEGFVIKTDDESVYSKAASLLRDPLNLHTLAELGWFPSFCGDETSNMEVPSYKLRFMEISTTEGGDKDKADSLEKIVKAAREFVDEPAVEKEKFTPPKSDGVGKAKDGETPKKTTETIDTLLPDAISADISEAIRH